VVDALIRFGAARRDQIESLARAPGVGGASSNLMSASEHLYAARLAEPGADGLWRTTGLGQTQAGATRRGVPEQRLTAVRDQPDLRSDANAAILAPH
jgi:hypothetical protein